MRIWIINQYAAPPNVAGITRHYNFARQLILRGHEVTVIAANYNHFTHSYMQSNRIHGNIDCHHNVPFRWIPTPAYRGNTIARFWNMLVFAYRLLSNKYLPQTPTPDLIIGSSPPLFAAFATGLLAKRLKIPFLFEVRDIWPETIVNLGKFSHRHPLIKIMRWMEKYLYRCAERIISVLPSADEYFIEHGIKKADILWLPNAIDISFIPKKLQRSTNKKFTLIYAGFHGYANDIDTLIKAAKILQTEDLSEKIHIYLIGAGPLKNNLKKLAKKLDVAMIEFLDPVPKNEIYFRLSEADAFLMLLKKLPVFRWGVSPNKLYDYMLMAKPIIYAVDTPYNPIIEANAGISISPGDPKLLAATIHQLALLPEAQLREWGLRGRDYVLQHHNISSLTNSLEEMLMNTIVEKDKKYRA